MHTRTGLLVMAIKIDKEWYFRTAAQRKFQGALDPENLGQVIESFSQQYLDSELTLERATAFLITLLDTGKVQLQQHNPNQLTIGNLRELILFGDEVDSERSSFSELSLERYRQLYYQGLIAGDDAKFSTSYSQQLMFASRLLEMGSAIEFAFEGTCQRVKAEIEAESLSEEDYLANYQTEVTTMCIYSGLDLPGKVWQELVLFATQLPASAYCNVAENYVEFTWE